MLYLAGFEARPERSRMKHPRRPIIVAVLFIIASVVFLTMFRVALVHGDSMLPTYRDGQMVLVNRLAGGAGTWRRGDVVLVRVGNDVLIKRVSKLPGETLSRMESEQFTRSSMWFEPTKDQANPLRVPPGSLVVLGDNKAVSDDSRAFGPVPFKDVTGIVVNAPPLR